MVESGTVLGKIKAPGQAERKTRIQSGTVIGKISPNIALADRLEEQRRPKTYKDQRNQILLNSSVPAKRLEGINGVGDKTGDGKFDVRDIVRAKKQGTDGGYLSGLLQQKSIIEQEIEAAKAEMERTKGHYYDSNSDETVTENLFTLGDNPTRNATRKDRNEYAASANKYYALTVGSKDSRVAELEAEIAELENKKKSAEKGIDNFSGMQNAADDILISKRIMKAKKELKKLKAQTSDPREERIKALEKEKKQLSSNNTIAGAQKNRGRLNEINAELKQLKASTGEFKPESTYDVIKDAAGIAGDIITGAANSANENLMSTADATLGNLTSALGWKKNNIFREANAGAKTLNNEAQTRLSENAYALGDKYNITATLANAIGSSAPTAVLAVLTGGPGAAGSLAAQGGGAMLRFSNAVCSMAKNPAYWASFIQVFGQSYETAKDKNASEMQAYTFALLNSAVNAAIEIGGGVETLPGELREVAGKGAGRLWTWFKSGLEEGGEEMMQKAAENIIGTITYGHDPTNGQSIADNLKDTLKEGAYGALGGLVLGGAQLSVDAALNAQTDAQYKDIGDYIIKAMPEKVDSLIRYAARSAEPQIREYAESARHAKKSDARTVGILYSYAMQDMNTALAEAPDIDALNAGMQQVTSGNPGEFIKDAAGAFYTRRLIELDAAENSETAGARLSEFYRDNGVQENSQLQNAADSGTMAKEGAEGYVRTDEFRRLQEASKGLHDSDRELYHSGSRKIDGELQGRLSGVFKAELEARYGNVSNANGILNLSAKGNQFNLYQNIDGELFHDVFEIARSYLRNGELVDLHEVNTTDEGIGYKDCFNYLSEDGLSGFSITPDGDLISVFNAGGKRGFLRAIAPIVKEKAKTLDCYASDKQNLQEMYRDKFGFKTASVMGYNMDYDHDNIAENHGSPDVAFMVNTDERVETRRFGKDQYDEAKAYRDSFVDSLAEVLPDSDSIFSEPAVRAPKRDGNGNVILSDEQNDIIKIGKALGLTVEFGNAFVKDKNGKTVLDKNRLPLRANGLVDMKNNHILIDYYNKKPLQFVFKHELTHIGEKSENYRAFVSAVEKSKTFEKWLRTKTGGRESTVRLKAKLINSISESRRRAGAPVSVGEAKAEMIADFVGDALFGKDSTGIESIIKTAGTRERGAIMQFLYDFISYIRKKLAGIKNTSFELSRLEDSFGRLLGDAVKNGGVQTEEKYTFAGKRAETADKSLLETAKERLENGENAETVRKETGWFKGYDGKWRFEIDDSMSQLVEKPKFENRGNNTDGFYKVARLEDILEHPDLFEAYPQLKDCTVIIQETEPGTQGISFKGQIVLSNALFERMTKEYSDYLNGGRRAEIERIEQTPEYKEYNKFYDDELAETDPEKWLEKEKAARDKFFSSDLGKRYYQLNWGKTDIRKYEPGWSKAAKSVLLHEIQHQIQGIEGFAKGSSTSPRYWNNKTLEAENNYKGADFKYMKKLDGVIDVLGRYGFYKKYGDDFDIITDEGINICKEYLTETGAPRGAIEMLEQFAEHKKDRDKAFGVWQNFKKRSPTDLYKSTAGEIEARDTENRRNLTAEQRKNTRPDIDRTDVVFTDGGASYSIEKSFEEQVEDVVNGVHNPRLDLYVSETPEYLLNLNFSDSPILMRNSKVAEILGKHSDMSAEIIKQLPKAIESPVLVLKSKTHPQDSVVIITDILTSKGEMIVPVWANQSGNYIDLDLGDISIKTNFVASAYGRNTANLIEYAVNNGGVLYQSADTKKVSQLLARNGLQLPTPLTLSDSDITVPQNEQSVNTNISENAQNDTGSGKKYSLSNESGKGAEFDGIAELVRKYDNGEISNEEYYDRMREEWQKAGEKYGTIPKGENAKEDYAVPKATGENKPTRRYVRTILETGKLTESMQDQIGAEILQGGFSYEPISDKSATKRAEQDIKTGGADAKWRAAIDGGQISKNTIALGEQLLADAIKSEDNARVLELSAELSEALTRAGQVVQSARLLKQMTGVGRLVSLQQAVKTINADLTKRLGDRAPMVKLDENIAQIMADSKTETEIEDAYSGAMQDVANQVPSTLLDKWNAWRYFAMLANPRTHIRNIVGNGIFIPAVRMKDAIATGIEHVLPIEERTKALKIKDEYREFAKKDLKNADVQRLLSGSKYDEKTQLYENRRTFKNEILESVTKKNGELLELEDAFFKGRHYTHALAGYLQARKADLNNADEKVLKKAREYAANEALKATFNDASAVASYLKSITRIKANDPASVKALKFAADAVIPFKRTPVNIIRRGVEYSPIGLMKTLTRGLYDVKRGNITVTEFADGLAAGLTGSGIFAVGMLLSSLGLVSGGFGNDREDKFKKLNGEQEYSVRILGKSYTVDWAAPACIPFFIGVETMNVINDSENIKLSNFTEPLWNALEPVTQLSMLSGIQSTISAAKYSTPGEVIATIGEDIALSYAMQGVPSLLGGISRTVDPTQRSWYTDKNSGISKFGQEAINNVEAKIPGLSYLQTPSVDQWGRQKSRGNIGERLTENFLSPGYYSSVEYDETNAELKRIYDATGEASVLPDYAPKSFKVNGKQKYLTGAEYTKFATERGQIAFDYVIEFMNTSAYEKLTDGQRAEVISGFYEYAGAKAKAAVSDYDPMQNYKTVTKLEQNGTSAVYYYINKAIK